MTALTPFRSGLMSVTFRKLGVAQIADLAQRAGLQSITWSADVHVPPGEPATARLAREVSARAALEIEAYGSYWRGEGDFDPILDSARVGGASRIRIWAGSVGSDLLDADERSALAGRVARAADAAAIHGVSLCLEFHRNTLTDTAESTRDMLAEIAESRLSDLHPVQTYWQPRPGITTANACAEIALLGAQISALHVFSWDENSARLPLAAHREQWRAVLDALKQCPLPNAEVRELMLEFVELDSPRQLLDDATELRSWLDASLD